MKDRRQMRASNRRCSRLDRACVLLLAGMLGATAEPIAALARAGGGQHFGGGGAGGNYGGGGSGLFGLWPLLFFGHGSGLSGLIVLLVIYYLYQQMQGRRMLTWGGGAAGWSGQDEPEDESRRRVAVHPDGESLSEAIAALRQRDPQFDERVFLDRAQTAFFKIQHAWAARNQDLARDVMSDALYERHKLQTDQLLADHQIDVLENIVIGNARIIDVRPATAYDSITVAFTASMTDYTIDERTRQVVSGTTTPATFTELWTFIRRGDAKSETSQTTLAATCPSCGAPLQLRDGKCDFCGAYVRTSSADWVVDTIEQQA